MVNFNGQITDAAMPPPRAARYGDGLFESIRVFDGGLPFWAYHWYRLQQGFRVLKMEVPSHFTAGFFQNEILNLVGGTGSHRARLTVWRGGGGLYSPESNRPVFLIEAVPLPGNIFEMNEIGLHVGICPDVVLPAAKNATPAQYALTNLKTTSALPFVLAGIYRQENRLDEVLLRNTAGRIACGGSSNVFLWENGGLATPLLPEGCVAGTMRAAVISVSKELGIKVLEKKITEQDLKSAAGFFLSNAILGIRWGGTVSGSEKQFSIEKSATLVGALNQRVRDFQ